MKKIKFVLLFILVLGISYAFNYVEASTLSQFTSKDLMYLEVNGTGRIITTTTTVDDIKSWYGGEARLETDSLFGGKAYSFYIGDKYDDYLYIETLEDGRIFSYGSTDPSYVTNTYSFGDDYPYDERNALYGCLLSDDGIVTAGVYYYKSIYFNGSSTKIINAFKAAFSEDETKAMLNLSKHATLMFNSIERYYNNENAFLTFNEDYFYINQQFRHMGTNLQSYMYNMGYGTSYYTALGSKTNCDLAYSVYYCFNPLQLAGMAKLQQYANFGDRIYPVWDYNSETKILAGAVYSTTCFDRADEVTLTTEEQSRLGAGRQEYKEAINYLNSSSEIYSIKPINNSATNIRAGELLQDKKEGITHYMNAIRVASGFGRLSLDEEGFNIGQHMSTLLSYRFIELGLPMSHLPAQPSGVSTEFYHTAIGYANSWNNNLAYSATTVSIPNMMRYINILLEDEDGSFDFGHRNYLLSPGYTRFGYGITQYFAVVELNGYRAYDDVVIGWPAANGVTFMESLISNKFKWTARFLSKYEVLNTTTAKVECLNTGEVWTFNSEENTYNRVYQNLLAGEVANSFSNKVLIYDSTIEPRAGYVYLITINGLKNTETGNIESYSYRSVFEYADASNYPSTLNTLKIKTDNLYEVEDRTDVYCAPIGRALTLELELDTSVIDKKVTWTSSNPDIVAVTQDGTIYAYAPSEEEVTITVKFDGSNVTDQIIVMPYISLEDVSLNKDSEVMEIDPNSENAGYEFYIETVPEEVTEILGVNWVLSDGTTEYYLTLENGNYIFESPLNTDNNLNDYFDVISVSQSDGIIRSITIRAKKLKDGIHDYILKTYVTAMSDMYNDKKFGGSCEVSISSPITQIDTYLNVDGEDILINGSYNLALKGNGPYNYKLSSKYLPIDATEKIVSSTWSSNNTSIATVDNDGNLTIISTGEVTIKRISTIDSGRTIEDSFTLVITAPLTSLTASVSAVKNTDGRYVIGYSTAATNIVVNRVPQVNTDELTYTVTEGSNIVNSITNGKITFKGVGNVTVLVSSKSNSSISTSVKFTVLPPEDKLAFRDESGNEIQYLNIDFNTLVGTDGVVRLPGYAAEYKLDSTIVVGAKPTITYSVKEGGENIVEVDSTSGSLIVKQGGEAQIVASVPSASGTPYTIEYTLISNKKSDVNNITLTSQNVSNIKTNAAGENIYYLYKNVKYIFTLNGDKTSNDTLISYIASQLSRIDNRYITYSLVDNVLTVTPTAAGETSLEVTVDTCSYVPRDIITGNDVTISNTQDRNEYGSDTLKTFKLNFIISDYVKGDVNKDGFVNSVDASIVLDLFKNGGATVEDYQLGDMNEDGVLNSTDSAMILDIYKSK